MEQIKGLALTFAGFFVIAFICCTCGAVFKYCDSCHSSTVSRQIQMTDKDGNQQNVPIDCDTDVFYMATWCPYSKELKDDLKGGKYSYLGQRKFVFVFSNELSIVEKEMRDGGFPESKIKSKLAEMKLQPSWERVFDQKFLDDLPGKYYFVESDPSEVHAFPTVYSNGKYMDRGDWADSFR